jgi:hypothetical protein
MTYPIGVIKYFKKIEEEIIIYTENLVESKLFEVFNCDNICPSRRTQGNFRNCGFILHPEYDWVIVRDNVGELILVPLKKKVDDNV